VVEAQAWDCRFNGAKAARPPRSKAEKEMGEDSTELISTRAIVLQYDFFHLAARRAGSFAMHFP
jgi:hypothetical protein